jgi:1-acyl-sn-glycerol-3-phosphate acyltransferase
MSDAHERPTAFYRFFQWIPRTFWRAFGTLRVDGLEHVPPNGAFLLISNHQSNLDPILIQACCPRTIHAMAKSTQFATPLIGRLMTRLNAYPVRRYQTDPQAVRLTLRRLAGGAAVGIYIEGERSWDGRLQAAKPGTVRIVLKAGVPVVPCTIHGTYDAWPRWDRRLQGGPIHIRFGPPIRFPALDRRRDREAALHEAADRLMTTLARQIASQQQLDDSRAVPHERAG